MDKRKSILNTITDIGGRILTLIVGIILPKLYIDTFGSEVNGLLSSITNILVYVNLVEAGIGGASSQALYQVINSSHKDVNSILAATDKFYRRTGVYFLTIVCVLAFLYPVCVQSELNYGLVVVLILLSAVPSAIKYFFQGKYTILLEADNRSYILNIITTVFNLLANISKIIIILLGCNVVMVQVVYALINIVQMLVIQIFIWRKYPWLNLQTQANEKAISKKKYVMVHTIASTIFSNVDVIVLTLFTNLTVVSIYTIYNMIFSNITFFAKSLANGFKAFIGQDYYADRDDFCDFYYQFSTVYRLLMITLECAAGILILPFLKMYAASFADANYIDIYLPCLFLLSNILDAVRWPEVVVINATGYFRDTMYQAILETIINAVGSLVLVFKFGIYGALFATVIALLYRSFEMIYFVHRKIVKSSCLKTVSYVAFSTGISLYLTWIYSNTIMCNGYLDFLILGIKVTIIIGILHFMISFAFYSRIYKKMTYKIRCRKEKRSLG